jgi:hypothetical protein
LSPGLENFRLQLVLVFKNEIVHFPESALKRGGFGSLGGNHCVRMSLREREVAKYEAELLPYSTSVTGAASGPSR